MKKHFNLLVIFIFGLVLGIATSVVYFRTTSFSQSSITNESDIEFLLKFVPLYELASLSKHSEAVNRIESTMSPLLYEIFKKNLPESSPVVSSPPLEVIRINGTNPYHIFVKKNFSVFEWTLTLETSSSKKLVSQISIKQSSLEDVDAPLTLWKNQEMLLNAPCALTNTELKGSANLVIQRDPFTLTQIWIQRLTPTGDLSEPEPLSLQLTCLDREYSIFMKSTTIQDQHTSYSSLNLNSGRIIQKIQPTHSKKILEKELGLDLEEAR